MTQKPDYIFETSWEVCNLIGGIYTVIATKSKTIVNEYKDHYITIGPDVWKETTGNPYFIEDNSLFPEWRKRAAIEGLKIRVGRWAIESKPLAILIDFTPLFTQKDKIFTDFWETYQLDSLQGQWDYIEPAMFGYASGLVIESFCNFHLSTYEKVVAQFHEWMTGTGVLYLNKYAPHIGTAFTTHATALGRAIASNGLPLYRDMLSYQPALTATRFNITSKQSIERTAANVADAFTTVSDITARECAHFLGRNPDVVTINGFDDEMIVSEAIYARKRSDARKKILSVASLLTGQTLNDDTTMVVTSGRYEFRNKGIDLFIDAISALNKSGKLSKTLLAVITVPANIAGPVKELKEKMANPAANIGLPDPYCTHRLFDGFNDQVINRIREVQLNNNPSDKVKIIFAPTYLNGHDGIFDLGYYDFLAAFDVSVFASYYEPWGYTPLESIANGIPTITTSLAGFGLWARTIGGSADAVTVLERTEDNTDEVVAAITRHLLQQSKAKAETVVNSRKSAIHTANQALWDQLAANYYTAYEIAINKVHEREHLFESRRLNDPLRTFNLSKQDQPNWKKFLIQPVYTRHLKKLWELSQNLWWSWNFEAIALFESISPEAWLEYEQNPISMMESLSLKEMEALENNPEFVQRLDKVYSDFKQYMSATPASADTIAYFSMEYGLHKSLKIYSGGLGILAGDYLKQASDSAVNLVGIGLLYRYGYFTQDISLFGDQLAQYIPQKFTHLPLEPVRDEKGDWVTVSLALPGRTLVAKAWKVSVGRIALYLLDTDIEENQADDRSITFQLYGGDSEMRFKQEMVLGVGGIRLLETIGIQPTIYHSNEGHSAFIGLERLRRCTEHENFDFNTALEIVRASTLFTTHTPVPAGHDAFEEHLLRMYMPHYAARLNIEWNDFMNLGKFRPNDPGEKFSMSVLATKLSQEVNGVSQIHGRVSREMFQSLYPGYFANELHIGSVTNGVHYPTWTDASWQQLYRKYFTPDFEADQSNPAHWAEINKVSDSEIWELRKMLKAELISYIKYRVKLDLTERQESPKLILKTIEALNADALILGFARRFATYKRAHLLFTNLERLSRIVNRAERPVIFLFAGKAHPNDKAGQDLIKRIIEVSKMPEFIGKVLFIENYDMELGKRLTNSVDIWLNTPTRPLEASGTSGEKAVMNGVLNFSVLDGWWAEGYKKNAGWAIQESRTYNNQQYQDELDAETIYNLLEGEIVKLYYTRNEAGVPEAWIKNIKNNIAEIAPHFTMKRMLDDYFKGFYGKLIGRTHLMRQNNYALAHEINAWKNKVRSAWDALEVKSIKVPDPTVRPLEFGENFVAEINLNTPGLSVGDVGIELLVGRKLHDRIDELVFKEELYVVSSGEGWVRYRVDVPLYRAGVYDYTFRIFPKNEQLPHRMDFPLLKWI
ncbi:MAG: alpha-glucan family phosphorylase [Bacteroidales bacterium]|nr:alpha-glucan family phosphorylase [Bacteroidales bacterium]